VQDIGLMLADKLIEVGFLAFGMMLFISNLVSAISTLYKSTETHFLMSSPLSHRKIFWIKFIDNVFYSTWATAIVGIPLFFAYSVVFELKWYYLFSSTLIVLTAFLLLPAFIGAISSIVFFILSGRFGFRKVMYAGIVLSVVVLVFYIRQNQLASVLLSVHGDLNILNYYLRTLSTSDGSFFMPWNLLTSALKFARWNEPTTYVVHMSALLSSAFLGLFVTDFIAERFYFKAFLSSSGTFYSRQKVNNKKKKDLHGFLWKLFLPFPSGMRSLLVKDIKLFLRDPSQWTQFGVLLVLLGVYLVNLKNVPLSVGNTSLKLAITFANYGFCGYILATLSVRFVYPSISMEGRSFWLVRSSPIKTSQIFWEKFWLAFGIFFIIAEVVAIISSVILAQSFSMVLLTSFGILTMSVSLISISVGLGILFPDFEESNPAKIASSGGGMITALISLIYVGLSVVIVAMPTYSYIQYLSFNKPFPTISIISASITYIVLNTLAIFLPLYLGVKKIYRLEH